MQTCLTNYPTTSSKPHLFVALSSAPTAGGPLLTNPAYIVNKIPLLFYVDTPLEIQNATNDHRCQQQRNCHAVAIEIYPIKQELQPTYHYFASIVCDTVVD